jgi:RHS repeat-associated protein
LANTTTANYVYDNNTLGGSTAVGDGNLTQIIHHPGGSAADRVMEQYFDWRDRLVATKQGAQSSEDTTTHRPIIYNTYDNLDEITEVQRYDGDGVSITFTGGVPNAPSASLLRAQTITSFDDQGRVYKTQTYSVDPSTGNVSASALTTQEWYNHRGLGIKTSNPGESNSEPSASALGVVDKSQYDGAGRETIHYVTDGGGDSSWSDAGSVTGDNVLSQVETTYDKDGNSIMVTDRERNHDETATGALGNETTTPKARVYYSTSYYDLANRLTATVDVGTNGGSAYTRPSTVPSASDTTLVTLYGYSSAGWVNSITDPRGIVEQKSYDNLGELTQTIEDYTNGTPTATSNKTTNYTFDGDGHMLTLQAVEPAGASQTTKWIYGVTTTGGSDVNTNDILATVQYPDPSTGNPSSSYQESYTANALGDTKTYTDRAGNVHTYTLDILGRVTSDAITTLATGFDGSIRRIQTAYDTQGNPYLITSYDSASGGNIVNQVQRAYNGLGQLTQEWQSHSGAVNTGTTPSVQYGYSLMSGGANHSRLTSITYPNGKVLSYNYGTSGSLADTISRLDSLSDSSGTLESYSYLGLATVVKRSHPQPTIDVTYIKQSGESNGDAGDQYTGLDRFGRLVDQRWINTSTSTATDRIQYGYDRDSNALYRNNLVNTAFGELYHASGAGNGYDNLNQLSGFLRGVLSASQQNGPLDTVFNPSTTRSWSPDALGNFITITTNGTTQTRNHNQQNEITLISGATTPTYDTNGNLTTDELGQTYKYDAWNRLVQVKNSGGTVIASYAYDGLGRRVQETHSGTVNDLFYSSAWQVLEERTGGVSTATVQYVWSPVYVDALVLRDRSTHNNGTMDERLSVQQDANWNVTALVNGSGSVVERYAYDPYGQVTYLNASWSTISASAYAWIYNFQAMRLDTATGNDHADARDYRTTLQRWIEKDALGLGPDVNWYRFVRNNPTNFSDPSGSDPPPLPAGMEPQVFSAAADNPDGDPFVPQGGTVEPHWWENQTLGQVAGDFAVMSNPLAQGALAGDLISEQLRQNQLLEQTNNLPLNAGKPTITETPLLQEAIQGAGQGIAEGATVEANEFTFEQIPSLNEYSNELIAEEPVLEGSKISGRVARDALIMAGTAGLGEALAGGAEGAAAAEEALAAEEEIVAEEEMAQEGIYEFTASSGKTYVGQSGNIPVRIQQHLRSGKLLEEDLSTLRSQEVLEGKTEREIAEQLRINELGGVKNLENIRNAIGPDRAHLLPPGTSTP